MRIFVTGASGFIGRAVCCALQGHDILFLSRQRKWCDLSNLHLLHGDLSKTNLWWNKVLEFRPEVVVHLAWEGLPDYSVQACEDNYSNSLMLFGLLEDVLNFHFRLLIAGSCLEYGDLSGPVQERAVPKELGQFGMTKRLLYQAAIDHCLDPIWARIFYAYGPGQRETSLIPSLYKQISETGRANINTPNMVHDFIHVEDVASALAELALNSKTLPGVYNVGTGIPTQVAVVAKAVFLLLDKSINMGVQQGTSGNWADISKMKSLGWKPKIPFAEGISRTIEELKR